MKIFCLGLHKTATVSLATALEELGYKTRHGYKKQSDLILDALYDKVDPLKYIEEAVGEHDAYADLYAVRDHFVWLHKAYPDAKFILTTRKEDEWVGSVKRQMQKRPDSPFFHHWYYQNELQWRMHKRMHEETVVRYFTMENDFKDQFLLMDITDGDGWEKLCAFLDRPVPDRLFPHKNKSPK